MTTKIKIPEWFFFYGTLMIPEILQRVLELDNEPVLYQASNLTHSIKMWGPYPALVAKSEEELEEASNSPIWGMAYLVEDEEQVRRLIAYEGENYKILDSFVMKRADLPNPFTGSAFVWQGYPEELEDGSFDKWNFHRVEIPEEGRTGQSDDKDDEAETNLHTDRFDGDSTRLPVDDSTGFAPHAYIRPEGTEDLYDNPWNDK